MRTRIEDCGQNKGLTILRHRLGAAEPQAKDAWDQRRQNNWGKMMRRARLKPHHFAVVIFLLACSSFFNFARGSVLITSSFVSQPLRAIPAPRRRKPACSNR